MPYFCLTLSPLLVNQKEERLIFLNEEIQTRKNISQGQITFINTDLASISPCNDTVCLMCVRVHQLREELLKCQVFLYDDSTGNGTEPMQSKH